MAYSINNKPKGSIFFGKKPFCILKSLSALLLIFCNNGLWAQKGNKSDSLLILYKKAAQDTFKVELLNQLCKYYWYNDPQKSIKLFY